MSAREDVLARIAAAHRLAPPELSAYDDIPHPRTLPPAEDLVERFVDRLLDYRALARRCAPDEIAATVAAAVRERGATSLVVPAGLDPAWLCETEVELRRDPDPAGDPLPVGDLDAVDGVLTGCALAIAETGTLILDGSPSQGRRAVTLVPDYHLCVVTSDQIRADVAEAIADLDATRPITMISGPSATSDIELNRVEGVHGPRTLEVIVVAPQSNGQAC